MIENAKLYFQKKNLKDYYINVAWPEECLLIFSEPYWTYSINLSNSYLTYSWINYQDGKADSNIICWNE